MKRQGLTLIEVLVVGMIVAIIGGILISSITTHNRNVTVINASQYGR